MSIDLFFKYHYQFSKSFTSIIKFTLGYEGDPFVQCSLNPCLTNPCGVNAECEESGTRAVCKCLDGYEGDPFVRYANF